MRACACCTGCCAVAGIDGSSEKTVAFVASLPALGYVTYFITNTSAEDENAAEVPVTTAVLPEANLRGAADTVVTNGIVTLTISAATGRVVKFENTKAGIAVPFTQEWYWYESSEKDDQSSGTGSVCTGRSVDVAKI